MDRAGDPSLVARLQAGDHAAFDEVFAAFGARLHTFLARLSRSRDVADDLLEETWLRLVTGAPRLRTDTNLGAWLFTVARNLHVSYCRSRALDVAVEQGDIALWPSASPSASPFEAAAASELERRLERTLAAIPAGFREVLLLVGVEGFTAVEAAAICGISPAAARQRLSRARRVLASEFDRPGAAPSSVLDVVTP
jgi:RNA polymerase sigma factor (sigma-70 family)